MIKSKTYVETRTFLFGDGPARVTQVFARRRGKVLLSKRRDNGEVVKDFKGVGPLVLPTGDTEKASAE